MTLRAYSGAGQACWIGSGGTLPVRAMMGMARAARPALVGASALCFWRPARTHLIASAIQASRAPCTAAPSQPPRHVDMAAAAACSRHRQALSVTLALRCCSRPQITRPGAARPCLHLAAWPGAAATAGRSPCRAGRRAGGVPASAGPPGRGRFPDDYDEASNIVPFPRRRDAARRALAALLPALLPALGFTPEQVASLLERLPPTQQQAWATEYRQLAALLEWVEEGGSQQDRCARVLEAGFGQSPDEARQLVERHQLGQRDHKKLFAFGIFLSKVLGACRAW